MAKTLFMAMDPFTVLGVTYGAPLATIRAKYHELARQHHPDKLSHLPPEERAVHEEEFKRVTLAYELLKNRSADSGASGGTECASSPADWAHLWSQFEARLQNKETVATLTSLAQRLASSVRALKKQATDDMPSANSPTTPANLVTHEVAVPVTLEEIHQRALKRVQLHLAHEKDPVRCVVDAGAFPKQTVLVHTSDGRALQVGVTLTPIEHPIFHLDDMLGTRDLFMDVELTLSEYFTGCEKTLQDLDGGTWTCPIDAMPELEVPLTWQGRGLQGEGTLYVTLLVRLPRCPERWVRLDAKKRTEFLNFMEALTGDGAKTERDIKV